MSTLNKLSEAHQTAIRMNATAHMKSLHRDELLLVVAADHSQAEIARTMGVSRQRVGKMIERARQAEATV